MVPEIVRDGFAVYSCAIKNGTLDSHEILNGSCSRQTTYPYQIWSKSNVPFVSYGRIRKYRLCVWRRRVPCVVCRFKAARPIPVKFGRPLETFRPQSHAKFRPDPPSLSISTFHERLDVDQSCYTDPSQSSAELRRRYAVLEPLHLRTPNSAGRCNGPLPRRPPNFNSIGRAVSIGQSTHGTQR
jgi:hypothetical protein